jgi:hypothetical protein
MVSGLDQFHVGVVTADLHGTRDELSASMGYAWGTEVRVATPVWSPEGEQVIEMNFFYSTTEPRLEIIQSTPGTLWEPAAGSDIHHLGYWSHDVPCDCAVLEARGYRLEAAGHQADGARSWAFLRREGVPRIELVSDSLREGLSQCWLAP